MIELQIYLETLPGKEEQLEKVFRDTFVPAISIQKGFRSVSLLKPGNSIHSYQLQLRFENEELRLKWVASDEHQKSFPKIAELCSSVSWQGFEVAGKLQEE
jgi:heme-degrading monooxygenase HmoA